MFLEQEIKCWAAIQHDEQEWLEEGRTGGINWVYHVLYVCEQWQVNYRDVMSVEYARNQGAEVIDKRCDCGLLMLRKFDTYEYCWDCFCSKELAQRGKSTLAKAKLAAAGVTIGDEPEKKTKEPEANDDVSYGVFASGQPL